MKFYCYKKCSTCKKAAMFMSDRGVQLEMIDYTEHPLTIDELRTYWRDSGLPLKKFFNTSGNLYRELDMTHWLPEMPEDEQLELLAANPMLVKRPILVLDHTVLVGFDVSRWGKELNCGENNLMTGVE